MGDEGAVHASALLAAARALRPQIRACRDQIEQERRLPEPVLRAMVDAGLFRQHVPRSLGGLEVDPLTCMEVVEAVAQADGAAGWNLMIGTTLGYFSGFLPESAASAVYGDPAAIVAGAFMPTGRAVPVAGGYQVSGRWAFASGIAHATWRLAGCQVVEDGVPRQGPDGSPELRVVFFPADAGEVLDTWQVGGLRGTGSQDFTLTDQFISEDYAYLAGHTPPREPGPLYQFPMAAALDGPMACVALGIARTAIDTLTALASTKPARGAGSLLRDRAAVQAAVARAEAVVRAARAWLFDTTQEVWAVIQAGGTATLEQQALLRLARVHAASAATQAVDLMDEAAGATALYTSSLLERCFRDVHATTKHTALAAANYETCGRVFLGMDPGRARL